MHSLEGFAVRAGCCLLILCLGLVWTLPLAAGETAAEGRICTGFHPVEGKWGWLSVGDRQWRLCPEQWAFLGIKKPPVGAKGAEVFIQGNCCPLPASDMLTSEHQNVETVCPDGWVVTGFLMLAYEGTRHDGKKRLFRCTKINQEKYQLGPSSPGVHWGVHTSSAFPWREEKFLRMDEVPPALLDGIRRETKTQFARYGCVGEPPGSLLVGKREAGCKGTLWREILRKEDTNDKGHRISIFPECRYISDVFSPNPECLK